MKTSAKVTTPITTPRPRRSIMADDWKISQCPKSSNAADIM